MPALARDELFADESLRGRALCRAYSERVDDWLGRILQHASGSVAVHGVALVAVGGYGRAELCPCSDIDVVLLHDGRPGIGEIADRVWYPIWDEGLKLGHAVRTAKEALALAEDDLDTATSLLSARHVAGDSALTGDLAERALAAWRRRAKRWLDELARSVRDRHARAGEVAFLLEPDLKEGRGGLRDVHSLHWAEAARRVLFDDDPPGLDAAYDVLLDARVELHRRVGRPGDRLLLQEQDGVAEALGDEDADVLMARVAGAARTIAWTSDEVWQRIGSSLRGPLGRIARRDRPVGDGVVLREGELHLAADASPRDDPVLALRAAAVAARLGTRIDRPSLTRLAAESAALPDPWPLEARERLAELLLAGPSAIDVIEALDQRGLLVRVLPEWAPVRSKPQRNAYHRFTVDRHLCEAAVGAAALAGRVRRPDLLVIGALLHDIGKGYPGDHTAAGMVLVRTIATRMGFPAEDVELLVAMVEHHLLLADVATRRDLSDSATVDAVAQAVGSLELLELLAALTEADSLATGPSAWGTWKAELVAELVVRTQHALGGGADEVESDDFPTAEQRELLARGETVISPSDDTLTVVAPDRPGLFSRVAGVLALNGLDVLAASALSTDDGMALAVFKAESSFGPALPWPRVLDDLDRALAGRLALHARLEERARTYRRSTPTAATPVTPTVTVDNDASATATVIEVVAPDGVGVLYRITRALAELDLDIRSAKVQTLGHQVVDAFYVVGTDGAKVTDTQHLAELTKAIQAAL
jgi:[protein-PII] uridylyltransferase